MTAPVQPQKSDDELEDIAAEMLESGVPEARVREFVKSERGAPKNVSPYAARRAAEGKSIEPDVKKSFMKRLEGFGDTGARHVLNAAQGLPGMKAFQAAAGSVGSKFTDNPLSYRESYNTLTEEGEKIPAALRIIEQMAGGGALMPVAAGARLLPKAPALVRGAASGAALGTLDPLLQGDPDKGVKDRLKEAGVGAVIGGAAAPLLHGVANVGKTVKDVVKASAPEFLGGAKSLGKQVQQMAGERRAVGPLYEKAIAEAGESTPEIQKFLRDPDIAERVRALQQLDQFKGLPADHPRMLDEIVKSLTDKTKMLEKGLAGIEPAEANIRRAKAADLQGKRAKLLDLLGSPGEKPPIMFDVPAERTVVEPRITPGREPAAGPVTKKNLSEYTDVPGSPTMRQAKRDFPESAHPMKEQGPGGPGFQVREQPDVVKPGVEIGAPKEGYEGVGGTHYLHGKPANAAHAAADVRVGGDVAKTPAMRVQTAPAEKVPAMMPGYSKAFNAAADRAGERAAFRRGLGAMRTAAKGGALTEKELAETSTPAMREWAAKAKPAERRKALAAILGSAMPRMGDQLKSQSGLALIGGGALLAGPAGAAKVAALKLLPPAARAHALRKMLDPMSETAFMKVLAAVNAGIKPN